jgi:hypothetical protein
MSPRTRESFWAFVGLGVLLAVPTARAHHSVAAGFDMERAVSVTGKIKSMEWTNPHAKLHVEVTDPDGTVQSWIAWFGSANNLFRLSWRATDLPVGATVTVGGFPARDGSNELYGGETTLPDGRQLFADPRSGR